MLTRPWTLQSGAKYLLTTTFPDWLDEPLAMETYMRFQQMGNIAGAEWCCRDCACAVGATSHVIV